MHLHRLVIAGIGPFPDEHEIDLGALGEAGLFLLEGPTGAGKSTVIDAIVFALYGKVAAEQTSDDRLRSRHCAPDRESLVDLVVETTSGVFRVRRTPAYQRARRRGQGTTPQNATVTLWRLGSPDRPDDGEVVANRADEVARILHPAIGLDREQFVQTVVLPQGEFSRFLRSRPEDRTELLQKVFGTASYERVQHVLEEMRAGANREVTAAVGALTLAAGVFRAQAGLGTGVEAGEGTEVADRADGEATRDTGVGLDAQAGLATGVGLEAEAGLATGVGLETGVGESDEVRTGAAFAAALDTVTAAGADPERGTALRAIVSERVEALRRAAEVRREEHAVAADARGAAEVAFQEGERLARALARRADLRGRLERLTAAGPEQEKRERRLAAARRARVVDGPAAAAQRAGDRVVLAEKALAEATEFARALVAGPESAWAEAEAPMGAGPEGVGPVGAGPVGAGPEGAGPEAEGAGAPEPDLKGLIRALAAERDRLATERAGLGGAAELESGLPARRRAAKDAGTELEALRERLAENTAALVALPEERAVLERRRTAEATTAATLPDARVGATRATERHEAARTAERLAGEIAALERDAQAAVTRARVATETAADLHRARIAGIAAEIAADLVPGEPCAVCGALDHPAPAPRRADHVDVDQVDAAEAERERTTTALSDLRTTLSAHRERHGAAVTTAGGDVAATRIAVTQAAAAVAAAEEAARRVTTIETELTQLTESGERLTTEAGRLGEELAGGRARAEAEARALAADEEAVTRAAAGAASVAARMAGLTEQIEAITDRHRAATELDTAREQARECDADVATALDAQGFADLAAAQSAALDEDAEAELDRLVREHAGALTATTTALADPELVDLPEDVAVDLDGLRAARTAAVTAEASADRAADRAEQEARAAAGSAGATLTAEEALAASRRRAAPVVRMGNLAGAADADNTRRLTLGTYVLLRRFQEVVACANERLAAVSSGRYALAQSEEREDGRARKTGLALKIVDHLTDDERDPRTLSGGETFYVSLCLALGLADVVTGEAGGIELGTLFIDEGFGTLDNETLDLVLRELGRLRSQGRVIGVVSHVEELKTVIPDQIRVRPTEGGASTLTVVV